MNVYKINMSFDDEGLEDGIGWMDTHLVHEEEYNNKELQEIMYQAKLYSKETFNEITLESIEETFIKLYGFKKLNINASVDFNEEL
ncbi:MAG: hypothetical protein ACRDD7_04280 [Peptostreptococcaceae bacterium]